MRISTKRKQNPPDAVGGARPGEGSRADVGHPAVRGKAGYGYLMQLLRKQETEEAEAALGAIQLERAREAVQRPANPKLPDAEPDPPPRIVCPHDF